MKYILNIFFLLVSYFLFAQNVDIKGHITNSKENPNYDEVCIYLMKKGTVNFKSIANKEGNFEFKNIPFGLYDLIISSFTLKDKVCLNYLINSESKKLEFEYPNSCNVKENKCPFGDNDNLIPFVYGVSTKKWKNYIKTKK